MSPPDQPFPKKSSSIAAHAALIGVVGVALVAPALFAELPFFVRLTLGVAAVLYLPGRCLVGALLPDEEVYSWEKIPLALAGSLCLAAVLIIGIMELHLNAAWGAWLLLGVTSVLLFVWHRRKDDARGPTLLKELRGERAGYIYLILVGLAALGWLLYENGGLRNPPNDLAELEEDALHVSLVRKLAENDVVTTANVMHKPDVTTTYVYPPYHFALALVSRVSGLDPIQVFVKFRPFAGLAALLTLYGLLLRAFARRYWADVSMLALVACALGNVGGQIPGSYWAQLIPITHGSDFGRGVELPLLLLLCFRVVRGPSSPGLLVLTPWFAATSLLIHTREVLLVLFFLAASFLAALLLTRRDTRTLKRIAVLVAVVVGIGLAYQARHSAVAGHAVEFEAGIRAGVWQELRDSLERPVLEVLREPPVPPHQFLYRGAFLLPFLAAPFLLYSRNWFLSVLVGASILASVLVLRVPYLHKLLVVSTYSEMVFVPARFFFPWMYVLLGLAIAFAVLAIDRLLKTIRWAEAFRAVLGGAAAALFGVVLVGSLEMGVAAASERLDFFLGWAVVGSLVAIALRVRRRDRQASLFEREFSLAPAAPLWAAAALVPVYFSSIEPTLYELRADRTAESRDLSDWHEWYDRSSLAEIVPPDLLRFLRDELPEGTLIGFPYEQALAVPLVSNHYVSYVARPLGTEVDFIERWLSATDKRMVLPDPREGLRVWIRESLAIMEERSPMFASEEPPELTLSFLEEFGVELLVLPDAEVTRIERLNQIQPGVVALRFRGSGMAAFEVHQPR